jgi:MarR family transcriptional regulator, organic hydroperoxide resistance regulator
MTPGLAPAAQADPAAGSVVPAETSPTDTNPVGSTSGDAGLNPFAEIGRAFKAAMASVRRLRGRETQRPGELSHAQYSLLFGLADGTARSASDLAQLADLSPATVTQMLEHLVATGLVIRVRSDTDRRVVLTSLTERGRSVVEDQRARIEPRWRAALSEFSDQELMTAAAVLDRLSTLFDELVER